MEKLAEEFLSLVVPAYNEESRLQTELPHVFDYLRENFSTWEVLYVDDGSTDQTYRKLIQASQTHPEMRVLRLNKNSGKGRAIRTGLQAARGDVILFSDADFSTPIEETGHLLKFVKDGYDIVISSRGVTGSKVEVHQPLAREITGKIGNAIVQTLLLLPFQDTQCGFKLFRAEAVHRILPFLRIDGFAFDIEILTIAVAQGLKIAEVPVIWRNVLESKVRFHHTLQVFLDVLKIRYEQAMGLYA
jgi:dolichyl-phosphate beta-glucosyltransferase